MQTKESTLIRQNNVIINEPVESMEEPVKLKASGKLLTHLEEIYRAFYNLTKEESKKMSSCN